MVSVDLLENSFELISFQVNLYVLLREEIAQEVTKHAQLVLLRRALGNIVNEPLILLNNTNIHFCFVVIVVGRVSDELQPLIFVFHFFVQKMR